MAARDRVTAGLVAWYRRGHRDLPWRHTRDPYAIWLSEVMLQQTRAQAAIPYYQRFLERFPNVEALAAAPEEAVLALWSGLGYYGRARNLHRAARRVVEEGGFPRRYDELRELPGIGDYTAAAVASIAFGERRAAVDGNVLRVVARVTGDAADIASPGTRERFSEVARGWMGRRDPAVFNQALMELGATVCLPRHPLCRACPMEKECRALAEGTVAQLPVKLGRKQPVELAGVLLVVRRGRRVLLRQRASHVRRMAGFWDLPGPEDLPAARLGAVLGVFRHTITHHHYRLTVREATAPETTAEATAREVTAREATVREVGGFGWFEAAQLLEIPLSTTARKGLKLAGIL